MAEEKKTAAKKTAAKKEEKPAAKKTAAKKEEKPAAKKTAEKKEEKPAAKKTAAKKEDKPAEKKTTKKTAAKAEKEEKGDVKFEQYKGKPLVRSGNTLYYGDLNEPYVICLTIKSESEINGVKTADDVQVQLIATDETLSPKDRILKKGERKGLYEAFDLGEAWLERQLKKG